LTFLAVGQGDCVVFQHAGATILVDAGPNAYGIDSGKRIIIPRLQALGVANVDLLLITHPDADHIGGAASVLERYPDASVGLSSHFREHPAIQELLAKVGERRVVWIEGGIEMQLGSFEMRVTAPKPYEDDNSGSLIIHLSNGASSAVLAGDTYTDGEAAAARDGNWDADILMAGHHGSSTSTGDAWLDEVSPEVVVISCGRDNPYDHPAQDTLARLERHGVPYLRTDSDGEIRLVPYGESWRRE
jgi:competence protein ComEC